MTTISDPLSAARALRVTIQSARKETEEARRLAPQVVKGLVAIGLCRLAVPAALGGHEAEPVVALQVYEELLSFVKRMERLNIIGSPIFPNFPGL